MKREQWRQTVINVFGGEEKYDVVLDKVADKLKPKYQGKKKPNWHEFQVYEDKLNDDILSAFCSIDIEGVSDDFELIEIQWDIFREDVCKKIWLS